MSWLQAHLKRARHGLIDGRASGVPDSAFVPNELKMGTDHEMEHTSDRKAAKKTAKDHLVEHPRYYSALKVMERKLSEQGE